MTQLPDEKQRKVVEAVITAAQQCWMDTGKRPTRAFISLGAYYLFNPDVYLPESLEIWGLSCTVDPSLQGIAVYCRRGH